MTKFQGIFFLIVLLVGGYLKAQEKGNVNFLVEVDNGYFEILVDDTTYLKIYKAELAPGHHVAKVWSPGYITAAVEFDVVPNETTSVNVPMHVSNERQAHELAYKDYRMKFHKSLTLPVCFTLASFMGTVGVAIAGFSTRNQIQRDLVSYQQTAIYSEVIYYGNQIDLNNAKLKNQRIGYYSMVGLTALSLTTTIFTYTRFKRRNTEPVLNSESPFKDRFSLNFSPVGFNLTFKVG